MNSFELKMRGNGRRAAAYREAASDAPVFPDVDLNAVRRALGGRLPDGPSPAVEVVDQLVLLGLRSSASRTATRERAPQHDRFGSRKHEVDLLRLDANEAAAAPNRKPLQSVVALVEYDVLDEAFIAERRPNPVALAVAKPIARSECRWALRSAQSILYVSKRRRKLVGRAALAALRSRFRPNRVSLCRLG